MFGFDNLMMSSGGIGPCRYLMLSWPAGSYGNLGFSDIRFLAGGATYPPGMTSNTEPWPNVITAASVESNDPNYYPYRAFDSDLNTQYSQSGYGAGWIKVDLGPWLTLQPDTVALRPRPTAGVESPPGPITLLGSNDDLVYVPMCVIPPQSWTNGSTNYCPTNLFGMAVSTPYSVQRYDYTGADVTITAPAGARYANFFVWGAAGSGPNQRGGEGGFTSGRIAVTAGQQFVLKVGQLGRSDGTRAWPSGGRNGDGNSGGGGGRSQVARPDGTLLLIGGGGGGGGWSGTGGPGGGLTGGNGVNGDYGIGGSQTAGGGYGAGYLYGGDSRNTSGGYGGGGDGYYGGGGGGDAGGGGGSGYINPAVSNGFTKQGRNSSHPLYQSGIGAASTGHGQIAVIWSQQ